jgi:hypothetical protein
MGMAAAVPVRKGRHQLSLEVYAQCLATMYIPPSNIRGLLDEVTAPNRLLDRAPLFRASR